MEKEEEECPSSSEEEVEEDMPLDSDVEALLTLAKTSGTMNNYPTWRRTLLRRVKEEQMKRFRKAQAIQRRLHEIEAALRELEAEGVKLELALRRQSSSPEEQKVLWVGQLLQLVQKKNSLVAEEAELMIT
ncbi:[F-actin]-monooxygenase mical1 [Saguinus oedipus]|uniref:[F-actin]-monooxygenase mical1 n=1 Tax=Saguinus oedipus TaxID=9490 RepID=A0ABQ9VXS2_SAGOE|nr:[F-actin]-monooxygenase mical1 [Saguinus oedipus]